VDADLQLMRKIHDTYGAAISNACQKSSVPESFLAALIANESGGNPNAKRFEKDVLLHLWDVLMGRRALYGSIGRGDIMVTINTFYDLDGLASSWGLTQIMGYHVLEPIGEGFTLADLVKLPRQFDLALRLMAQFANRYNLDVTKDFAEMFHCWNTGTPESKMADGTMHPTFDPNYVPNGLARKALYEQLTVAQPPQVPSEVAGSPSAT
jgi:hypothetical protein